jgi:hypothetical protein
MYGVENRAIVGKWTDYSTGSEYGNLTLPKPKITIVPATSWVVPTFWGYVIIAWAGIWLSLSTKYIKKILLNIFLLIHLWWNQSPTDDSEIPLLPESRDFTKKRVQALAKIYTEASGVRDLWWECRPWNVKLRLPSWGFWLCLLLSTTLISSAGLAMIVGGVLSAKMQTSGPAKLASSHCGLWLFDRDHAGDEEATRAGVWDLQKEERAAEYANDCYGTTSAFEAAHCNFFYRRNLPLDPTIYSYTCPFADSICTSDQAVTFRTPLIDSNEIGINNPAAPRFYRNTTCAILNMEYPYIQNITENGNTTFYYYYGESPGKGNGTKYTYKTQGDPFDRLATVYDVL